MALDSLSTTRRSFLKQATPPLMAVLAWRMQTSPVLAQAADRDRFPLSLHQYSLKPLFDDGRLTLETYPSFAKETLSIANIEFAAEFCAELLTDSERAKAIREKSQEAGVTNRTLLCGDGLGLDAASADDRKKALGEHMAWAKVAEALGCAHLRVRASTPGDRETQLDNAASGIGALCDALQASKSRVSVLIENIAEHSRDPEWLVALVERIGPRRVGLIADFGNFNGDLYAGMQRILPYTTSVCTKSWEFDASGNETQIDFQRMMGLIKASKFEGCIAIEYLGQDPVEGIRQTAALIERYS